MTSHYETLGVERDATFDDIKLAFRRRSSAAHPDREGGSVEAQQAINAAWEVLGDPERRAHYDATGQSKAPQSVGDAARAMLLALFGAVLDDEDATEGSVLRLISRRLEDNRREEATKQENLTGHRTRLVKQTGKIRCKHGDNLAQMVIDQKIAFVDSLLPQIHRNLQVIDAAVEELRAYEADEIEPRIKPFAPPFVGNFYTQFR